MTKRTITLLTLAFMLAGAGTANAATPAPMSPLSLRTARFIITNDSGGLMSLTSATSDDNDTWRETPGDIPDGGVGDYTLTAGNWDVSATLDYEIRSSGDEDVTIFGANPLLGRNTYNCEVHSTEPSAADADWDCKIRQDKKGYDDTNFYVTVTHRPSTATAEHRAAS